MLQYSTPCNELDLGAIGYIGYCMHWTEVSMWVVIKKGHTEICMQLHKLHKCEYEWMAANVSALWKTGELLRAHHLLTNVE